MADKCYRVQFIAHLHKLALALKIDCQIEVIWKRGQKKCESGKVRLVKGQAIFNKKISIECNMVFDTKDKIFKQKITKFTIILVSDKGTKQAGQVQFDVAQYINSRQLTQKDYEVKLTGCPDKNAKLKYSLTGNLKQQINMDVISQSSYLNTQNKVLVQNKNNRQKNPVKQQKDDRIRELNDQNLKMTQKLKQKQKLERANNQLRLKIKKEQFQKTNQVKQKIDKYKKQVEKMKSQMRLNKKIQDQTNQVQKNLLSCKVKMMRAFNYAAQFGGSQLLDAIQAYCGLQQK